MSCILRICSILASPTSSWFTFSHTGTLGSVVFVCTYRNKHSPMTVKKTEKLMTLKSYQKHDISKSIVKITQEYPYLKLKYKLKTQFIKSQAEVKLPFITSKNMFWSQRCSTGSQHGKLHQSLLTMSRMTILFCRLPKNKNKNKTPTESKNGE